MKRLSLLLLCAMPCITPAQTADAPGASAYRIHCASCHGSALQGDFGPALLGKPFADKWRQLGLASLERYVSRQMPPASPNSLSADDYRDLTGYLAQRNGIDNPLGAHETEDAVAVMGSSPATVDAYYQRILERRAARLHALTAVTDAMLDNPSPNDWLMWRRAYDTAGYSPLTQINKDTVAGLKLAWSVSLTQGTNGIAPLVHDGVMFFDASGSVLALDAATGDCLWKYSGKALTGQRTPISQPRGIALYGDSVIVPTSDGHVLALDFRTGQLRWDTTLFPSGGNLQLTAAPLIAHDKIVQGVSGCSGSDQPGGCFIVGLDAKSGKQLWRFNTISRPGLPGADSWNGAPVAERFGGSVWITGSYDPQLNLIFFGTGQTYSTKTLLMPNRRKGKSANALFTDSTVALDPGTGKLVWYYQHLAGDVWDLDWAFERTLITLDGDRGPHRIVLTGGKDGIFDLLDAKTGQYLSSGDMGIQTLVSSIDARTGEKRINPAARVAADHGGSVCPFIAGGRNWPSTSYDPTTALLYVPLVESCMDVTMPRNEAELVSSWTLKRPPGDDGLFGRVSALDVRTGKVIWTNRRRAPPSSAMLATAGHVVFEGSRDRVLRAVAADNGATLWQTALSDPPNSFPITYSVDGEQYIAVVLGGGTVQDILYRTFTPELINSNGARSVWVFKLSAR